MTVYVVPDFETASGCDLKAAGAFRYADDPSTEILSLAFQAIGVNEPICLYLPARGYLDEVAYDLRNFVDDPDVIFVAHNAAFEKAIWRAIMVKKFGWPDIPNERWEDTLAHCAMRAIPQDLENALRVLRLPNQKDTEGSKLTISMSKPNKRGYYERDPEKLKRIYRYNASDIKGQSSLFGRLGPLPSGERAVWLLDQQINERGVRLDCDYIGKCSTIVADASEPLIREFVEITGGYKPSQAQKVGAWIKGRGIYIPDLKKETVAAILGSDENGEEAGGEDEWFYGQDIPADVERVLRIRQLVGSASIKKLARMEKCVGYDSRARGVLQYHGAAPGLWAGRLFQPQNFPRGTIQVGGRGGDKEAPKPEVVVAAIMTGDYEYVAQTLGPPVEVVVGGLRHAIIADRDRVLLAGDLAGIQARTVLALAGQHDKVALMASGADVYLDNAKAIYKDQTITKKTDPEKRQIGKGAVLGLGFQMGAKKFRHRMAPNQTPAFAENVVQVYRKEWAPLVPKLWYALEEAAVRAVWDHRPTEAYGIAYRLEDGWLTARLPSGRKIWYFNPQPVRRTMPYDELIVKQAWTCQAKKMGAWKTIDAFGGLLTENVVMGMQRDMMVHAAFNLERNKFPLVLNVHDEWIAEPKIEDADPKAFKQLMEDMPPWVKELQIPVSVEVWDTPQERYRK